MQENWLFCGRGVHRHIHSVPLPAALPRTRANRSSDSAPVADPAWRAICAPGAAHGDAQRHHSSEMEGDAITGASGDTRPCDENPPMHAGGGD